MKKQDTILVVDDEEPMRQLLRTLLEAEGFKVIEAAGGAECLRLAYVHHPDLVLLDILMPDRDGREVCQRLRDFSTVPIIMLTAVSNPDEKVGRLKDGADDYVSKPFYNAELVARIRSVLRRSRSDAIYNSRAYEDGMLKVDFEARQCLVKGSPVSFSPTEWRLLECLISRKDRVVTHQTLLRSVWGVVYENDIESLKVYIAHLRRKLRDPARHPRYIHTEREVGYRFESHT